jgi:hypothetical protein
MYIEPPTIQISKLDAAQQQLRTATRLWFYDIDPVSAHSLACAAHEVIHVVSKIINPNRPELLFDSAAINPAFRKSVLQRLKEAANFFKHADNDPHDSLEFMQGLTWSFIYYSIYGLQLSDVELMDEFLVFRHWTAITMPEKLTQDGLAEFIDSCTVGTLAALQALSKQDFFDLGMKTLARSTKT